MGTCYSKKASGGNRPYTTVHMASTKLDEASRLARPTPYARTQNANIEYAAKKGIPLSTKYNSYNTIEHGDIKNLKNNFQSNIPRFSSSLPATSVDQKTVISNGNDNETLHVVNNNPVITSRSASNIPNTFTTPMNKLNKAESQIKPKSVGSKSCPDKLVTPDFEDKGFKTPGKASTGLPRQLFVKSSHSVSQMTAENNSNAKSYQSKFTKTMSSTASPLFKSSSQKGFESRDSLSDFDSGLGNSQNTDKQKPEDSDTVKDLERLELSEDSSHSPNGDSYSVRSMGTPIGQSQKLNVKAPTYKREPNGKWSYSPESEHPVDSKAVTSGSSSPREKHSFKINASDNIFSTYASYKGLLSYQKKSFKPLDSNTVCKEKAVAPDKSLSIQMSSPNTSCIPKIRKHANQSLTNRNSLFYVQAENDKPHFTESEIILNRIAEKSSTKQQTHSSKQSSIDSDEKSDSTTENGVMSPPSDVGDRDFLIDDEIADQPDLTLCCDPLSEDSDLQSLQMAVSELHALQLSSSSKRRTDSVSSYSSRKSRTTDLRDSLVLGSDLGSSCSSIASDDLMMDYEKTFDGFPEGTVNEGPASPMRKVEPDNDKVTPLRTEMYELDEKTRKRINRRSSGPFASSADKLEWRQRTVSLPLRPPRQMSISEADDGCLKLDSSSYRLLCQDLNGVKTLLFRLKTVIQEAETINPFDQTNPKNIFYHSLVHNDFPSSFITLSSEADASTPNISNTIQENGDLRRQIVLLQQQLEDKDHTIHLLQQQMTKYLNCQGGFIHNSNAVNAATQTERSRLLTSSLSNSSSSADDSIETLVSFRITKYTGRF